MIKSLERVPLTPSLWRTCRALANYRRLDILRLLLDGRERTVTEVREAFRISRGTASQYLRILNARGFLAARRCGRETYYRVSADEALPAAAQLIGVLSDASRRGRWPPRAIFHALTAMTHPRRLAILRALQDGPLGFAELRDKTGISFRALRRHLEKLQRRGFVNMRAHLCHRARPHGRLASTLLKLAAQ